MADDGDFDMDDLIEEDDGDFGADADEEDMMQMMEEQAVGPGRASGGAGKTVTATTTPTAQTTTGADDDDLEWLAQAGGTQVAGGGAGDPADDPTSGDGEDADDSEEEDELALFASFKPPPLSSNARCDSPRVSALAIEGEAVVVTGSDGKRAFVKAEPKTAAQATFGFGKHDVKTSGAASFLLGEPIETLLDRLENTRREAALAKRKLLEEQSGGGNKTADPAKDRRRSSLGAKKNDGETETSSGQTGLWVDAHAPKNFTELLSAENVNREVLHWLKAWDGVVFKRAPPKPARDVRFGGRGGGRDGGRGRAGGRSGGGGGVFGGGSNFVPGPSHARGVKDGAHNTHVPLDSDGRPTTKVLLLSGPPGVGKTTLAHVAAKHAGYRVVEVNASDDRGAEALHKRVCDATQMRSVLMGDTRPNCVVIDEIDGALGGADGKGAIHALLTIVNGSRGPKSVAQTERDARLESESAEDGVLRTTKHAPGHNSKNQGKRKGNGPLMRPIICICNDPYAPALRPLREIAKVFKLAPPSSARLNGRLREVCSKRYMAADTRALGFLAERSEGDIRACLNALQMINQEGKGLTLLDVDNGSGGGGGGGDAATVAAIGAACGEKDLTVQARSLWQTLLSGHIANKRTRKASRDKHQKNLANQCASFGDDQLLIDGLFENVHSAKFQDASMGKCAAALDALCVGDYFTTAARTKQQWHLLPHVTASVMRMHATLNNAPAVSAFLEWPQGGKVFREKQKRRDTLRNWSAHAKPLNGHALAVISNQTLACEIAPFVLTTIAPEIRPVSSNFMKPHELVLLRSTVSTMACLGLTYAAPIEDSRQTHNAFRGAPATLHLDPPIDDLVLFGQGVPQVNLEPGSSKFGGSGGWKGGGGWKGSGYGDQSSHTHLDKKQDASLSFVSRRYLPIGTKQMLTHEVKLEQIRRASLSMHGPGTPPLRASDQVTKQASVEENKTIAQKRLATAMGGLGPTQKANDNKKHKGGAFGGVSYKYNEGVTNAVRRGVYLRDLS